MRRKVGSSIVVPNTKILPGRIEYAEKDVLDADEFDRKYAKIEADRSEEIRASHKEYTPPPQSAGAFSDDLNKEFDRLQETVTRAYETGVTLDEAEKLAAKCLGVQLKIAAELASLDIDSRMKKSGMKAAKAQVYLDLCRASDKKPSDTYLEQEINLNATVNVSVDLYERASANFDNLSLYMGIFKEAHVYFRGVAKGTYSG